MTKKKDYIVKIEMDREKLVNILAAASSYTSNIKDNIIMDCSKEGFMLSSVEFHNACALVIAVGKPRKPSLDIYDITTTEEYLRFGMSDLNKLASFFRESSMKNKVGTITIREKWITCKAGNLTKRIERDPDPGAVVQSKTLESFQGFYNGLRKIGEVYSTPLLSIIKDFASIKKDVEGYYLTFKETKKMFSLIRDLGQGEDIDADITELVEDRKKKDYSSTYNIYEMNNGLKYVSKLSDTIMLMSESEVPMVFTHHGTEPEKGREYPEELEFWYSVAPVFIEE